MRHPIWHLMWHPKTLHPRFKQSLTQRHEWQNKRHWPVDFGSYIYLPSQLQFRSPFRTSSLIHCVYVNKDSYSKTKSIIKCMRNIYIGVRGIGMPGFFVSGTESSSMGWWYKQTRRHDLVVWCSISQPSKLDGHDLCLRRGFEDGRRRE